MCCFSKAVRHVGGTRIFARRAAPDRQYLAYSMEIEIDEPLAMILPLPVPADVAEDAVRFVDLRGYERFFDDLDACFPPMFLAAAQRFGPPARSAKAAPLVVHEVGDFVASFVPTVAEFSRLDLRFRLPNALLSAMSSYRDHGFAVFQLAPKAIAFGFGAKRQRVHPMAFSFPTRASDDLFFPTVHVHDGTVPERARFDHTLFAQDDGVLGATLPWMRSLVPLGERMSIPATHGLVDPELDGFALPLHGELPNVDTVLRPPPGVTLADLSGEGVCHRFRIGAKAHYGFFAHLPAGRAWKANASERLGPLARGLRAGLLAFEAERRDAYRLAPLTEALPPHFLNGPQLWTGTDYRFGAPVTSHGPGRVRIEEFTDRVEPQTIELGFDRVPEPSTLERLRTELRAILDRAVASASA